MRHAGGRCRTVRLSEILNLSRCQLPQHATVTRSARSPNTMRENLNDGLAARQLWNWSGPSLSPNVRSSLSAALLARASVSVSDAMDLTESHRGGLSS
jgi:hypothetical protein